MIIFETKNCTQCHVYKSASYILCYMGFRETFILCIGCIAVITIIIIIKNQKTKIKNIHIRPSRKVDIKTCIIYLYI